MNKELFMEAVRCRDMHGPVIDNPLTKPNQLPEESRHCAFCLKIVKKEDIKHCAKCHKRCYCSKQCQKLDWKPKGKAQGHKNWCGLECGEEDDDWEVVFIPGRRAGIRAKKLLPPLFRIMVEGFDRSFDTCNPTHQKAINDSRRRAKILNHECDANAGIFPVCPDELDVFVIYSWREIQPGEEICTNYTQFNDIGSIAARLRRFPISNPKEHRERLEQNFGITCPTNCFCRKPELEKIMHDCRQLDFSFSQFVNTEKEDPNDSAKVDLEFVKIQLRESKKLHSSPFNVATISGEGFEIGIQKKETFDLAMKYIKKAYDFYGSVTHPEFNLTKRYKNWMKNPESHENYMKLEKK